MKTPPVVSRRSVERRGEQLLVKEKQLTRRATPSRPNAGGCRGSPWRRSMSSPGRTEP